MKKKITFLTVLLCLPFVWSKADVVLDETFASFAIDSKLNECANWNTVGTEPAAAGSGIFVRESALTYSDANGEYILSGAGNKVEVNGPGGTGTSFNYFKGLGATYSSGYLYLSFLYKANVTQTQVASPVLAFLAGASNNQPCITVFAGKGVIDPGKVRFGVLNEATNTGNITWGTDEYATDATLFIVVKQDFANAKTTSVFINPPLAAAEPAAAASNSFGTNTRSPHSVMFSLSSSVAQFQASGIRVSTTWDKAVEKKSTAPQLAAPVVGAASNVKAESATANWTPVANAVGYTVNLYTGTAFPVSYPVTGQTASSLAITGLLPSTTYTYTVIAKGDALNQSDSGESAASAPFTTLAAPATVAANFDDGTWGDPLTAIPAAGAFSSSWSANGFDFVNADLCGTTITKRIGPSGEQHINAIVLDRSTAVGGSSITLPMVKSIEQIEIHAYSNNAAGRVFTLQELVGTTWTDVQQFRSPQLDTIIIIPVSRQGLTKLRIMNASNGQNFISAIITRVTNPAMLVAPVATNATNLITVSPRGFTANWQPVNNAVGYRVIATYASTVIIASVTGQSATSCNVTTDAAAPTNFTYQVVALGDGTSYLDSYVSNTITVEGETAIGGIESGSLAVYATGNVIYSSEAGMLEIFNLQGALMLRSETGGQLTSDLPKGMYIVRLQTNSGKQTVKKIVINE